MVPRIPGDAPIEAGELSTCAFDRLPVRLAQATLDLIEQSGPGVKLSRPDVSRIVAALDLALDQGLPAV